MRFPPLVSRSKAQMRGRVALRRSVRWAELIVGFLDRQALALILIEVSLDGPALHT